MSIPFTPEGLVKAINKRRPVKTPIRDALFGRSSTSTSDVVTLDVKTSPEGLAVAISRGVQSRKAQKDGWEAITLQIPHFSEHDIVKTGDLINVRGFGKTSAELLADRVAQKMDAIKQRFERTIEFMCVKGLQGEVVDGGGNVIATYNVGASTAATVSDGTDDPNDVFDDAALAISRAVGGDTGQVYAFMGAAAYKNLRNSPLVQKALNNPAAGPGIALFENGEVSKIGGVNIVRLPYVFIDNSGTEVPFIGDNDVIVVSEAVDGEMVYGPCETTGGPIITEYFADMWEERDPPATKLRVEVNPLPLVSRPDSIKLYTFA